MGSALDSWCASEAGVNAGENPAGGVKLFTTEASFNCIIVR